MTDDYLVFGLGHEGTLKTDEPGLKELSVVTAAVMLANTKEEPPEYQKLEFKNFTVSRHQGRDGKWYNIAYDVQPNNDRVNEAIFRESPRPSSTV